MPPQYILSFYCILSLGAANKEFVRDWVYVVQTIFPLFLN